MKNQGLKNLVQRSNLLKVNDDFIILSEHNNAYLRGGGDGGCDNGGDGICNIVIDGVCNTYNNGCTPAPAPKPKEISR